MSTKDAAKPHFATCKDVAETLDVDERTVRRWCVKGLVDAELLPGGKEWRVRVRDDGFPLRP